MPRTYSSQLFCPIASTLNIIGDRWTLLVLRDVLVFSKSRFGDLLESLEGISANLLSDRLKRLEERGILEKVIYNEYPPRAEYRPTDKGRALLPVLREIYRWGSEYEPPEAEPPERLTSRYRPKLGRHVGTDP
jgi:DNA-binding HxlR family transcriptional regulator